MEAIPVLEDLTQFQSYRAPIDLTFNQYLLAGSLPILVHTGDMDTAGELEPRVRSLLGSRPLAFIVISHFESDECGGLRRWLDRFPEASPVCSEVTARQLAGFGISRTALVRKPGELLEAGDWTLEFLAYPAEMHLWEGLVAFERRRRILFSADLFIRRGLPRPAIQGLVWRDEVEGISPAQVPAPDARAVLQTTLAALPVEYVAPGHGPFLKAGA
jgi:flavorubredoxin